MPCVHQDWLCNKWNQMHKNCIFKMFFCSKSRCCVFLHSKLLQCWWQTREIDIYAFFCLVFLTNWKRMILLYSEHGIIYTSNCEQNDWSVGRPEPLTNCLKWRLSFHLLKNVTPFAPHRCPNWAALKSTLPFMEGQKDLEVESQAGTCDCIKDRKAQAKLWMLLVDLCSVAGQKQ